MQNELYMNAQLGYNQFNALNSGVEKLSAVDQYNQQLAEWEQRKNGGSSQINGANANSQANSQD